MTGGGGGGGRDGLTGGGVNGRPACRSGRGGSGGGNVGRGEIGGNLEIGSITAGMFGGGTPFLLASKSLAIERMVGESILTLLYHSAKLTND